MGYRRAMARLPRLVLPGYPYHVTQRGNRRQQVFLGDADYVLYRDLLAEAARRGGAQIWAYCLMPNHVHVIVVHQTRTACVVRSPMRIAAIPASSMRANAGPGICGKVGSGRW
jgi:REP element-mobilizing transposase RayT